MKTPEPDEPLTARISKVQRHTLPDGFKESLLDEIFQTPPKKVELISWWMPPRWLGFGLAACWFAIFVFQFSTPQDSSPLISQDQEADSEQLNYVNNRALLVALNKDIDQ